METWKQFRTSRNMPVGHLHHQMQISCSLPAGYHCIVQQPMGVSHLGITEKLWLQILHLVLNYYRIQSRLCTENVFANVYHGLSSICGACANFQSNLASGAVVIVLHPRFYPQTTSHFYSNSVCMYMYVVACGLGTCQYQHQMPKPNLGWGSQHTRSLSGISKLKFLEPQNSELEFWQNWPSSDVCCVQAWSSNY